MKFTIIILITCFLLTSCFGQNRIYKAGEFPEDIYYEISGVWIEEGTGNTTVLSDFSWGVGEMVPNFSFIIDLGRKPPYLWDMGGWGIDTVEVLEENKYKITTDGNDGDNIYIFIISIYNDEMRFEKRDTSIMYDMENQIF